MDVKALERDPRLGNLDFALGPFDVERYLGKQFYTPLINAQLAEHIPPMPSTQRSPYDSRLMREKSQQMADVQKQLVMQYYGIDKTSAAKPIPMELSEMGQGSYKLQDPTFGPTTKLPFFENKPNSLLLDMHGGGPSQLYSLQNNQAGTEGLQEFGPFMMEWGKSGFPEKMDELKKKQLQRIYSIACNMHGGGTPEFYDQLLGGKLNEAIITPPGYSGFSGQQTTNAFGFAANKISGNQIVAPQHKWVKEPYKKLGIIPSERWSHKGEHYPLVDRIAGKLKPFAIPAGIGIAGLSYALYRRNKKKRYLDMLKRRALENAAV